jgi:hypothetical protein
LKKRTITRGKETGRWLTILPTFVDGTELSSHEWQESFLLRYSLSPLGLPLNVTVVATIFLSTTLCDAYMAV